MEIIIKRLEESNISLEQIVELIHNSFQERLDQGLNFTCSFMGVDDFKRKFEDAVCIVGLDPITEELLAVYIIHITNDKHGTKYGYLEYLAVDPKAKRSGIGTKMLNRLLSILQEQGGEYVLSDTAAGATSSINWHYKNGFKRVKFVSYRGTNYYSHLFRMQFKHPSKWDYIWYTEFKFFSSVIKTRLFFHKDGSVTAINKLMKKCKR